MDAPERIWTQKLHPAMDQTTPRGHWYDTHIIPSLTEYIRADLLDAANARAEAAEAAAKTAREALGEIAAAVGCLEGKDRLDRELIRNIKESLAQKGG